MTIDIAGPLTTQRAKPLSLKAKLLAAAFAFIGLWATSFALFRIPGLYIVAVLMVPVIFTALILITKG